MERGLDMRKIKRALWTMGLLVMVAVSGCALTGKVKPIEPESVGQKAEDSEKGWWYANFHIDWLQDTDPNWYIDVILAHKVVSPVLDQNIKNISLWRFHRRAVRDKNGHQFSFIFYASRETAQEIYRSIGSSRLLGDLISAHLVVETIYDDTTVILRPDLEATSDRGWSPEIKKTWPFYIMGVSRMWLNLIDEVSKETIKEKDPPNLDDLLENYRKVSEVVDEKWRQEGSHAFLHHLNAIFGYQPLIIYERRLENF